MARDVLKDLGRSPTLEDVAAYVGLSVATVGRALGDYGRVSAATKERVLRAARDLNYHPNTIARGMKEQRTRTIGLIVGNIMNPFFSTIVRAVEDTVTREGFSVIVCNTDEDPGKELAHAKTLYERRVDGLIVSPTVFDNRAIGKEVKRYYGKGIPTVFVDRRLVGVSAPYVLSDNEEGAYKATYHLLALGHRYIGVIAGKRVLTTMAERICGYERALAEAGIDLDETLVMDAAVGADVGVEGGYSATQRLLQGRTKPSALLVLNNLLVVGALRALKEADLKVPRDLSLVTWDDFELAEYLTPSLTLVDQPTYAMGSLAAEQLLKALADHTGTQPATEPLEIVLKSRLVVRASTAAPSGAAVVAKPPEAVEREVTAK